METDTRAELLRRADLDQAARRSFKAHEAAAVDAANLPWLRELVGRIGWPGHSVVGEDGAHAAWLLVQHADADPAFQRRCLELLTAAAEQGQATRRQVAYLTDRVLIAEGAPQEYGTQVAGRDGVWAPMSLGSPASVDARREAMSLEPLATYLARFEEVYGPPEPSSVPCPGCGADLEFWLAEPSADTELECLACGETLRLSWRRGRP